MTTRLSLARASAGPSASTPHRRAPCVGLGDDAKPQPPLADDLHARGSRTRRLYDGKPEVVVAALVLIKSSCDEIDSLCLQIWR
jgi:hypothetical protein